MPGGGGQVETHLTLVVMAPRVLLPIVKMAACTGLPVPGEWMEVLSVLVPGPAWPTSLGFAPLLTLLGPLIGLGTST